MAENSKIEWTDHTFNAWTGCTKVSPGCDHCYAESWAKRSGTVAWGDAPRHRTTEANWRLPLKWNAQAEREGRRFRVFCASLADVFDNAAPTEWRRDLFDLIIDTPNLDWLLLTKRIGNAAKMMDEWIDAKHVQNLWLGATVVNQEEADRDIPKLQATPARVRFLSMEPLLGPVDLTEHLKPVCCGNPDVDYGGEYMGQREVVQSCCGNPDPCALDWVIVGGESGHGARPMHPDWARSLRDQCAAAGVPFLFKQWGEWVGAGGRPNSLARVWMTPAGKATSYQHGEVYHPPGNHPWRHEDPETLAFMVRAGKKAAGRLLDGRTHDGFPESA